MERKRVTIQGLNVDKIDFDKAVEYAAQTYGQVVTLNPEMIQNAVKNPGFANIIQNAELVIPDGIGVELGLKILGQKVCRIAGIEFARKMVNVFAQSNRTIGFLGAKPEIIEKAVENIKKEVPNANIVYVQDGYFTDEEQILNRLKEKQPQLLLVALGSPKQEEFIYKAKEILPQSLMIGVGGSFDVWSGVVQRAPEIYQKLGIEWLYRTVKEPKRFKRIFPTLPLFVLQVIKEKVCGSI